MKCFIPRSYRPPSFTVTNKEVRYDQAWESDRTWLSFWRFVRLTGQAFHVFSGLLSADSESPTARRETMRKKQESMGAVEGQPTPPNRGCAFLLWLRALVVLLFLCDCGLPTASEIDFAWVNRRR